MARASQRLAHDAANPPVGKHRRAECPVELDGRRVPVEDGPFEAAAAAIASDARQRPEQRVRAALATEFRAHVEVFEPEPRPSEKRREIVEEEGKGRRSVGGPGNQDFGRRPRPEERSIEIVHRADAKMGQLFVRRELVDHRVNLAEILATGGLDVEDSLRRRHAHPSLRPSIARSRSTPSSSATRGSLPQSANPARSNSAIDGRLCAKTNARRVRIPAAGAAASA